MKELLLQLIRLQELTFAKWEHEAADSRIGFREIEASIDRIFDSLPQQWARLVRRLQSGGQPAVVPATNGFCAFCQIQLPTSMIQDIRKSSDIHQCPCCARILYLPEGGGLQIGEGATSRYGRGGIGRFSSVGLMVPNLKAESRDEALQELVQVLAREGWVDDPEKIVSAAVEREALVTTAVEYGLAFPHVRGVEGGGLVVALGLKKKGLYFGAPANRFTRIIFFSVIPQAASGFYLRVMASLVRAFREEAARKRLLACLKPEETWETLKKITQEDLP